MKRVVAVLLSGALSVGCASIAASRTQSFSVTSNPPGAEVRLNGQQMGVTPTSIEIPRHVSPAVVEVAKAGHASQSCNINKYAGGGYVAADTIMCVLLFPLGCIAFIDAGGAWNEVERPSCNVTLAPLAAQVSN